MDRIKVGFLGCGNIGSGVWELLSRSSGRLEGTQKIGFDVKRILVKDPNKQRLPGIPAEVFTLDPQDVIGDPQIRIIVEMMGGDQPAAAYILQALRLGKTVVTANKMALALHWDELMNAAVEHDAALYYEAAVCGAIPVVNVFNNSLQANRLLNLMGIVNGTTNYILTRMSDIGSSYEDALKEAQALGFAEPDPTSDVEGYDAAYKLSILASLAFHKHIAIEDVHREGITGVTPEDIAYGREFGYAIKLLAIAKADESDRVQARVHPTFVPVSHPLSSVKGSFNSVFLTGDACGDMMLYGRGAGSAPTASAVVSDMLRASRFDPPSYPAYLKPGEKAPEVATNWKTAFYIRFSAQDRPGVLAHIASRLGEHHVSIRLMNQSSSGTGDEVPIVLITHQAWEKDLMEALKDIDPDCARTRSVIRVEEQ